MRVIKFISLAAILVIVSAFAVATTEVHRQ